MSEVGVVALMQESRVGEDGEATEADERCGVADKVEFTLAEVECLLRGQLYIHRL